MTTQAVARRRIPEYLEADEVNSVIRAAPSPKAMLLPLSEAVSDMPDGVWRIWPGGYER